MGACDEEGHEVLGATSPKCTTAGLLGIPPTLHSHENVEGPGFHFLLRSLAGREGWNG